MKNLKYRNLNKLNLKWWSEFFSRPYLSRILVGLPALIIGTWIGYKLIFLKGINKNVKSNNSPVMKSLIIFLFTFLACWASWSICQEIQMILQKAFGIIEASKHGWFDGIIDLPILLAYSFIPCLIAASLNGIISFIIYKTSKTNHNK